MVKLWRACLEYVGLWVGSSALQRIKDVWFIKHFACESYSLSELHAHIISSFRRRVEVWGEGAWKIMVRNYEIWIKQLTESTAWSWVKFVTWGYCPCSFLSFQYCCECSHMEHWASWHLSSDVITDAALQSDTIRSHSLSTWSFIAQVCVESKHKRPFRSSSLQWEIGFDCRVWQFSFLTITGTHEIDYSSLAKWARDNSTKFFQTVKCSAL